MQPYALKPMSEEQKIIVSAVVSNNNVIVDSVAGSGKTTTSLHICSSMPKKKILILTYNSKLKIESRDKVKQLGLKNVQVHSYHAFCVKYYNDKGIRDEGIQLVISSNMSPNKDFHFDLIILDEQQDMTSLFYKFVKKIINDNKVSDPQLCLFGDIYQNIYSHVGSDDRYLVYGDLVFGGSRIWTRCKMSVSYRITNQMAEFINLNLLKYDRLAATKNGVKVKYVVNDMFRIRYIYELISGYLKRGYSPDDIFVLGPSIRNSGKSKSPINLLENMLVGNDIPCYTSSSDDCKIDEDIIRGKVCFSSFHQVKGMERKICLIFNFDDSYFNFYNKDGDRTKCPNVMYVALTRASEVLILLHHYESKFLPFIDKKVLKSSCDIDLKYQCLSKDGKIDDDKTIGVTDLLRNLSSEAVEYLFSFVKYDSVNVAGEGIKMKIKVNMGNLCEDVSDINGHAIPLMYEYKSHGKLSLLDYIAASSKIPRREKDKVLRVGMAKKISIESVLYVANVYIACRSGFIGKLNQIKKYNWISEKEMDSAMDIMKKYVSKDAKYEQGIKLQCTRVIEGSLDAIDGDTVWEFKCVSVIGKEHILQVVVYMYMYHKWVERCSIEKSNMIMQQIESMDDVELIVMCHELGMDIDGLSRDDIVMLIVDYKLREICLEEEGLKGMKFKLLNILTEEILQVQYSEDYSIIVDYLVNSSLKNERVSDEEFINGCLGWGAGLDDVNGTDNVYDIEEDDDYMFA